MSFLDIDDEFANTPPEMRQTAQEVTENLLPDKSRERYNAVYTAFIDWKNTNRANSFSENVLLAYFSHLAEKYKISSLWAYYSMLRSTLNIKENVNIEKYLKLRAFLKRKTAGFVPKTSKTFTPNQIRLFLDKAPDEIYLVTKVALIMGIMGACRCCELYAIQKKDIEDHGTALVVTILNTKTKVVRKFTITGKFYNICKKYMDLRQGVMKNSTDFFLKYQNGKCYSQRIGINKISSMGKGIASYLKLDNPTEYTGHSFRRSSATLYVDAGGDITGLKRHGGWKSTAVEEGYIDDSMTNKLNTANLILGSVDNSSLLASSTIPSRALSPEVASGADKADVPSLDSKTSPAIPSQSIQLRPKWSMQPVVAFEVEPPTSSADLKLCQFSSQIEAAVQSQDLPPDPEFKVELPTPLPDSKMCQIEVTPCDVPTNAWSNARKAEVKIEVDATPVEASSALAVSNQHDNIAETSWAVDPNELWQENMSLKLHIKQMDEYYASVIEELEHLRAENEALRRDLQKN